MSDASTRELGPTPGVSVLGIVSLVLGILGAVISLVPCIGMFVGVPLAGVGLILGLIGLVMSLSTKQTGVGLPIAGTIVSLLGLGITGAWIALFGYGARQADEEARAQAAKTEQESREIREGPAVDVSAAALYRDYDTNAINADTKYKGKVLQVKGEVERVDRTEGVTKTATVELKTDEEGQTVDCDFKSSEHSDLANLKPGQKVTIRGKCIGRDGNSPKLEKCVLMKGPADREPADKGPGSRK